MLLVRSHGPVPELLQATGEEKRATCSHAGSALGLKQSLLGFVLLQFCTEGTRHAETKLALAGHAAGWPRVAGAWGSPRRTLAPNGAPRAPAGRSPSHLVLDPGTRPTLYLLELQLIPQTRSRGLGAFLVHALEELARAHRSMSRARGAAQSRPEPPGATRSQPAPALESTQSGLHGRL